MIFISYLLLKQSIQMTAMLLVDAQDLNRHLEEILGQFSNFINTVFETSHQYPGHNI